jgi:hypothetical protein
MATSRICSILDCGKPKKAFGWCRMHYARWRKHGDPSVVVRTTKGEPLQYLNAVVLSAEGNDCFIWPFARSGAGYGQIRVDGKIEYVHRIVCKAEHGDPPNPDDEAAHSCGKGHEGCVHRHHLSWKSHAGNHADCIEHGTRQLGEKCVTAKLSNDDVMSIMKLRGTMFQREIAVQFGVSLETINGIFNGRRWHWLTGVSRSRP